MFNVCPNCGQYRADKTIDPAGPFAICPECGHKHRFRYLPLLVVCGASGTGKSTLCLHLAESESEAVILEGDILWRPEFNRPKDGHSDYFETWLRLGKNISQSGRPLAMFVAGAVPGNIEPCVERRYFSTVHYLALTCNDDVLRKRLQQRPAWRESGGEAFINAQLNFNRWFKDHAKEGEVSIELLDTTHDPIEKTVEKTAAWIQSKLVI